MSAAFGDRLLDVAWMAQKLAFRCLRHEPIPPARQMGSDVERLGSRIDVIELQTIGCSAADALTTEHGKQGGPSFVASLSYILGIRGHPPNITLDALPTELRTLDCATSSSLPGGPAVITRDSSGACGAGGTRTRESLLAKQTL